MIPTQPTTQTAHHRCRFIRCRFTPVGTLVATRLVQVDESTATSSAERRRAVSWRIPLCVVHRASVTTSAITSSRIDAVEWEARTDWSSDGGDPT